MSAKLEAALAGLTALVRSGFDRDVRIEVTSFVDAGFVCALFRRPDRGLSCGARIDLTPKGSDLGVRYQVGRPSRPTREHAAWPDHAAESIVDALTGPDRGAAPTPYLYENDAGELFVAACDYDAARASAHIDYLPRAYWRLSRIDGAGRYARGIPATDPSPSPDGPGARTLVLDYAKAYAEKGAHRLGQLRLVLGLP